MPKVVLDHNEVGAVVGQGKAARVAQHVWPHATEARALASFANEVVHCLACHGLAALGDEQPRQLVLAHAKVAPYGAQLIALDRLFG
jgi:hypothetical protein